MGLIVYQLFYWRLAIGLWSCISWGLSLVLYLALILVCLGFGIVLVFILVLVQTSISKGFDDDFGFVKISICFCNSLIFYLLRSIFVLIWIFVLLRSVFVLVLVCPVSALENSFLFGLEFGLDYCFVEINFCFGLEFSLTTPLVLENFKDCYKQTNTIFWELQRCKKKITVEICQYKNLN